MEKLLAKLAIVIANYNQRELLRDCLGTVIASANCMQVPIIVIDNFSPDGSADMVKQDFPDVQVIRNRTNVGYARANNQGWYAASADLILFLNNDTRVPEDAFANLVNFMHAWPHIGGCGPRLAQPNGHTQSFAFGGDPTPGYLLRRGWMRLVFRRPLHNWETKEPQAVDWVSGASLLIRRQALEQVGGFDENFFMYFEDNDLCLRLRQAGWPVYYNPQVTITHLGGVSLAQNTMRTRWYDASLRYFYSKHYSVLARVMLEFMLPFYRRMI